MDKLFQEWQEWKIFEETCFKNMLCTSLLASTGRPGLLQCLGQRQPRMFGHGLVGLEYGTVVQARTLVEKCWKHWAMVKTFVQFQYVSITFNHWYRPELCWTEQYGNTMTCVKKTGLKSPESSWKLNGCFRKNRPSSTMPMHEKSIVISI